MVVLKVIAKILLIPVVLVLMVIQWVGIFLNSISGVIFGILAFIFALTGIASLAFGLASGQEGLKMLFYGFVIFLIPHLGNWLIGIIIHLRYNLDDYIRS